MMQAVRLVPNRVNQFLIVGPKPSLTIMITIIYTVITLNTKLDIITIIYTVITLNTKLDNNYHYYLYSNHP